MPVASLPSWIGRPPAFGDFNTDGKLDFVGSDAHGGLFFFRGNGDGTFQPPQILNAPVSYAAQVAAGEFNSDGNLDLAVMTGEGLRILFGNGDGTFGRASPVFHAQALMLATDVNADGRTDLVIHQYVATYQFGILLGNGDGSFRTPQRYFNGFSSPHGFAVSDLNGDGIPDLSFSNPRGNNIGVLLGKGAGTFGPVRFFAAGAGPTLIVPMDFNADGKTDLAVVNRESNSVTLLINTTGVD